MVTFSIAAQLLPTRRHRGRLLPSLLGRRSGPQGATDPRRGTIGTATGPGRRGPAGWASELAQPVMRRRTPLWTSAARCCSPAKALTTTRAPVSAGTAHCSTVSFFWALATSGGVAEDGEVPDAAGTAECSETVRPRLRDQAVAPSAAEVSPVLARAIEAT